MEKRKPLCSVGIKVNLFGHYGGMEVPHNIKTRSIIWSTHSTCGYLFKEIGDTNLKRYVNLLPQVHCSIVYIIYKIWKQPKYPLTDEWIKIFFENIFSQPSGLFSHSQCLCSAEFFNFNEVQLINSFFHGSWLWCFIEKFITLPRVL